MARPKKPKYEYVEKLNLFRKRVKDIHGKYVAVYGRTPDELTEKLLHFNKQQERGADNKDGPWFNDFAHPAGKYRRKRTCPLRRGIY